MLSPQALKFIQIQLATPVKEHLNPWVAFTVVGVLQGAVYGQANVFLANAFGIQSNSSFKFDASLIRRWLRGSAWAGGRDCLSQGVPFMMSESVDNVLLEPICKALSLDSTEGSSVASIRKPAAVMIASVCATYLSQGMHNCQITMQANQSMPYAGETLTRGSVGDCIHM